MELQDAVSDDLSSGDSAPPQAPAWPGRRVGAHYACLVEPRLRAAVASSVHWYEDIFALHGIPTAIQDGLWRSLGRPPRWHSAAKTTTPGNVKAEALRAVEAFDHCAIADSFGVLDLSDAGFSLLFEATWVHHPALTQTADALPEGWSVIGAEKELEKWNREHDTLDVLLPPLLIHPRFQFLCEKSDDRLLGGAVLHDTGGGIVGMSNEWAVAGREPDPAALLSCAANLYPGCSVVGYEQGQALEALLDEGFTAVGPQRVWAR